MHTLLAHLIKRALTLWNACTSQIKHPWRDIFKKDYRPEFTIAFGMPFLQQLTGVCAVCPLLSCCSACLHAIMLLF